MTSPASWPSAVEPCVVKAGGVLYHERLSVALELVQEQTVLNSGLMVVHILVCLLLITFILLHAGRGGGLSDMSGSTVVERNLDRLTVAAAIVFTFTTILLGLRVT